MQSDSITHFSCLKNRLPITILILLANMWLFWAGKLTESCDEGRSLNDQSTIGALIIAGWDFLRCRIWRTEEFRFLYFFKLKKAMKDKVLMVFWKLFQCGISRAGKWEEKKAFVRKQSESLDVLEKGVKLIETFNRTSTMRIYNLEYTYVFNGTSVTYR